MSEARLRRFHAANAGITARVLARGGSYERLAAYVPDGARVLDLGCGDGHLLRLLTPRCRALGLDLSLEEGRLARCLPGEARAVQGRASALPFHDHAFDMIVSHMAFMLMDAGAAAEIMRTTHAFHAVLGGGPTAHGNDIYHRFLDVAKPRGERIGDPRTRSEAGWRELFPSWRITFERFEVDLSGHFDDVYPFFAASYEDFDRDAVRAALRVDHVVPCTVVMWLASATR